MEQLQSKYMEKDTSYSTTAGSGYYSEAGVK